MPNLSGINIALQAILAQSHSMQVIEHNVSNANTPGYRRQAAILMATSPTSLGGAEFVKGAPGQIGTGVTIDRIQRFNLQFFDTRFRSASADASNWEAQSSILNQFEPVMAETSLDGLTPKLDEFWASWQTLSTDPTNYSLRAALLDNASSLANGFTRRTAQISQLRNDQNLVVTDQVGQINSLATEVASLNGEISRVLSVGEQPNDLLDKRDLALDQLATLTGAAATLQKSGEVSVSIGGHVLVVGHDTFQLSTQTNAIDKAVQDVYWSDGQQMIPPSGSLKGVLDVRDNFLTAQQTGLDNLAGTIIDQVNTIHLSGYGPTSAIPVPVPPALNATLAQKVAVGDNFFTGTKAIDMAVNTVLSQDLGKIATADASGQAGNNAIAVQIAALKFEKVMGTTNTLTMNEFYNGQITDRSLLTQRASENATQQNLVVKSLSDSRESVSGVSLDEEAANMAKTQKAYQAAARMLTAYDEMLDTVINRMGLVGR